MCSIPPNEAGFPLRDGGVKGYDDEGLVVENVAVGFPQGFLCTLLTGESHKGLAFHPALLH